MKFEVLYKKTFLKDLRKLPKDIREKVEQLSFDLLPETEKLYDIKGLEKLVSHEGCYKIRFGDYRVGLQIDFGRDKELQSMTLRGILKEKGIQGCNL